MSDKPQYYFQTDITSSTTDSATESSSDEKEEGSYTGFFEGPEKTLEVLFHTESGVENGLRNLSRAQLDHLCELAKCSILSTISSPHVDAYVLSESSLFIYKHKYIMKTCGTTTLLRCLNALLKYADELNMQVESVVYSRKNLTCPTAQMWPHSSFGDEIKYIHNHANLQDRLHGNGYILGPVTGDHWFVYVADLAPSTATAITDSTSTVVTTDTASVIEPSPSVNSDMSGLSAVVAREGTKVSFSLDVPNTVLVPSLLPRVVSTASVYSRQHSDRTLNMMMFGLAPEVCFNFFKANIETGKEMTQKSGISRLCPGATIDETAFTPCGYSMNALLHDAYYTTHITPEEACSYASFETNACLTNYSPLVRNALTVFKPKRFVVTMFGDETGIHSMMELPTDMRRIDLPGIGAFVRTSQSSTKIATECCCYMAVYTLETNAPMTPMMFREGMTPKEMMTRSDSCNSLKRPRSYSMA